jgi:hypothetical protein
MHEIETSVVESTGLRAITIPRLVKRLGDLGFEYCSRLTSVDFEANSELEEIGRTAFVKPALKRITIPSSVRRLGDSCFSYCSSLTSVGLEPNSVVGPLMGNPIDIIRIRSHKNVIIIAPSDQKSDVILVVVQDAYTAYAENA